jgi:ferredoxin
MRRIAKVTVHEDVCIWHRCCSHIAPRVFLEVDGTPEPVLPDNLAALLESDREQVIRAVLNCPIAALSLEFEDGREISMMDLADRGEDEWVAY